MNIIVFLYATYANAWLESYCSQSTIKKTSITENLGADEKHMAIFGGVVLALLQVYIACFLANVQPYPKVNTGRSARFVFPKWVFVKLYDGDHTIVDIIQYAKGVLQKQLLNYSDVIVSLRATCFYICLQVRHEICIFMS